MDIVLVPGMLSPPHMLHPLRNDLRKAGHDVYMFEAWPTLTAMQYRDLLKQLRKNGPAVVIGHSLGGLLAVLAADRLPELFVGVIGLDSFVWGDIDLDVPYYEVRGWLGNCVQIRGVDELKRTPLSHMVMPLARCVRQWVLRKVEQLSRGGEK